MPATNCSVTTKENQSIINELIPLTIPTDTIFTGTDGQRDATPESLPIDTGIVTPTVATITTETTDGTGIFDVYMRAGMNQLDTQYNLGRIRGPEYATAYMETLGLMIEKANTFAIRIYEAEKNNLVTSYELSKIRNDSILIGLQSEESIQRQKEVELNGPLARGKVHMETELLKTQRNAGLLSVDKATEDILFIKRQNQELKANGAIDRTLKVAQTTVQDKNSCLIVEQTREVIAKTSLIGVQEYELGKNGVSERLLKDSQTTVQGKQGELYDRQRLGFSEKHKRDKYKIALDAWAIQAVEDPTHTYVIDKLKAQGNHLNDLVSDLVS